LGTLFCATDVINASKELKC